MLQAEKKRLEELASTDGGRAMLQEMQEDHAPDQRDADRAQAVLPTLWRSRGGGQQPDAGILRELRYHLLDVARHPRRVPTQ